MRGSKDVQRVLVGSFVAFRALANNSPGPTQRTMAERSAGECLWALGIDEHNGVKASAPQGETIEIDLYQKRLPAGGGE